MDAQLQTAWILTLLLAACRAGGVAMLAPPTAGPAVPIRLRVLFALVAALAALGRLAAPVAFSDPISLGLAVAGELLIGVSIGLAVRLIFVGIQLGAEHIAQQIGIGLADAIFPGGADHGSSVRRLLELLAVVVFLLVGGHRMLFGLWMHSTRIVPPGTPADLPALMGMVLGSLSIAFLLALKVAAPVLAAMILTAVTLGLLQRTMPQVNILSVGLPLRSLLGLVVLAGSVLLFAPLVDTSWQATANLIQTTMGALGN